MQKVPLSNGQFALVDDEDFEFVRIHKWHLSMRGYAYRRSKRDSISMHHDLMAVPEGHVQDHINGDRLDNRRTNLRPATALQNSANAKRRSDNTSGYKGVCWNKQAGKWKAQIRRDGKRVFLGYFTDMVEAANAYDRSAKECFGEFAKLNFA